MDAPQPSLDLVKFGWRLAVTMLFVLLNGFFVAAEFALVKVRPTRLRAMTASGIARARVTSHIHAHLDRYLSACQLGITLSSLILGWLAEPAVAELLLAGAVAAGVQMTGNEVLLHGIALAIALSIVTLLHMTIGEQAPKIWAINRAESTALFSAYPLRAFEVVFRPFIWAVNELSNGLLRLAGMSAAEVHESVHNVDELKSILATSAEAGHITGRQQEFAANILGIMELEVRHILVPRVDIAYLSLQNTSEDNLRVIRESGHSRFPLCKVGLDTVIGTVHSKDVMTLLVDGEPVEFRKLARKPVFVPDTQPVSRLILTLQRMRSHMAVVLDEHGTAIGLAFLEDALEEIVGPIQDEFDQEAHEVSKLESGVVELSGSMALPDAADVLELPDLGDEADTIGGHVTALLGRLPRRGDELTIGGYRVTVCEMSQRRVGRLRFEAIKATSASDDPATER